VSVALFTVRLAVPLLERKLVSPAKLATTELPYVPAFIPEMLTLETVATPLAFVVALPTGVPFRLKLMLLPVTGEPIEVRVADSAVMPP
jgi:hypothetical protein